MSDLIACYRSAAPEVLAAWDAYGDDRNRFSDEIHALTEELWPEGTHGTTDPIVATSTWDPGKRTLVGWSWPWGVKPPEGWKVGKGLDYGRMISPKQSTKVGKAIRKRMDGVRPVAGLDLPGMPLMVMVLPSTHTPAVERHKDCHGDFLYVGWAFDVESHDHRSTPGGKPLDMEKWERIKVSEFFAARENDSAGVPA